MEVSGQLRAPAALPPGIQPQYSLYRRLGGPHSTYGRYGEDSLPGIEPRLLDRPALSLIAISTELTRLPIGRETERLQKKLVEKPLEKKTLRGLRIWRITIGWILGKCVLRIEGEWNYIRILSNNKL
jgi:hypothetical protein